MSRRCSSDPSVTVGEGVLVAGIVVGVDVTVLTGLFTGVLVDVGVVSCVQPVKTIIRASIKAMIFFMYCLLSIYLR
jgi:hypothetical protein